LAGDTPKNRHSKPQVVGFNDRGYLMHPGNSATAESRQQGHLSAGGCRHHKEKARQRRKKKKKAKPESFGNSATRSLLSQKRLAGRKPRGMLGHILSTLGRMESWGI